jgi:hypothetical protein
MRIILSFVRTLWLSATVRAKPVNLDKSQASAMLQQGQQKLT